MTIINTTLLRPHNFLAIGSIMLFMLSLVWAARELTGDRQ